MTSEQHSSEFIEEMKGKLIEEKDQLEKELGQIAHKQNGEYSTDFPSYERDEEENANESADFIALQSTTQAMKDRLEEVNKALGRIESGNYGVSAEGEVIPENRLRANPAATTIVHH
jgi:RNA polymerase-binding transcription factor DksA